MTEKYIGIVDEPNPKGSKDTLDIYRHADALTEFIRKTSTPMALEYRVNGEVVKLLYLMLFIML